MQNNNVKLNTTRTRLDHSKHTYDNQDPPASREPPYLPTHKLATGVQASSFTNVPCKEYLDEAG